jgi:Cytoskeletal-regulatory complex EF hand
LFQAADDERIGSIGGTKAVTFFTRSKLPITILKDIWTLADQPPTNALDPMKFAVAIRLIQCEQNGIHLPTITSSDLSQGLPPNLRPAYFDGIPPPPPGPGAVAAAGQLPPAPAAAAHSQPPAPPPPAHPRPPTMNHPQPHMGAGSHQDNVSVAGSAGGHNHQLAVQDPYMITPSEQVRYEQLFPDYVQQDPTGSYMSGSEAVALFNKSGLPQAILSQIWNMVDTNPVDNQLDKIEFVLAMHLIVCISKKNLPVPPSLPLSLKNLKAQQQQPPPHAENSQNNSAIPQTIYQPHPPNPSMSLGGGPPPSTPDRSQFQQQPQPVSAMPSPTMMAAPPPVMTSTMPPSMPAVNSMAGGGVGFGAGSMAGPPPLSQPGGASISDAFEGLDAVGGGMGDVLKNPPTSGFNYVAGGDTGSISSYHASTPEISMRNHTTFEQKADVVVETIPEPSSEQYSNYVETTTNNNSSNTNKDYVSAYKMGESSVELQKLKEALQKLQAENISLKASMGSLSLEEQETQKELNATIAEVTKLSNELTKTRAQALASKSRLLQATAELKAAKEKTSYDF